MDNDFKLGDLPYERPDAEEITEKYKSLTEQLFAAPTFEKQEKIHREYYKLADRINTMMTLAHIRRDADLSDRFYEREANYCDKILPRIGGLDSDYHRLLSKSAFRGRWEKRIGTVSFINMALSERSQSEKIIPLMQEEADLVARYEKIIQRARIPFGGKVYSLSLMSKFTTSGKRELRMEAWKAIDGFFARYADEIDGIYDRLVKCRTAQARGLGFSSFVELGYMRMHRNCYDRGMVERLRDDVRAYIVPLCNRINEKRREQLDLRRLRFYDQGIYFPNGNPVPKCAPEDILERGRTLYHEICPETGEFFDFMLAHELFDTESRKSKRDISYMTYLSDYRAPFIFAYFNGTNEDINIITHECGHAFQAYTMREEPCRELAEVSMDIAEIHSKTMEYFTYVGMDLFFEDKTEDYYTMHSGESVLFIPYGCMVDEFQHIIYDRPFLSTGERRKIWRRLEDEYRPHIDFEGTPCFGEGGFWHRQHHIFSSPFYYIDYVIAALCALQYKTMMDRDYDKALESYLELCRMSGKYSLTETLDRAGLKSPFEKGVISDIAKKVSLAFFGS